MQAGMISIDNGYETISVTEMEKTIQTKKYEHYRCLACKHKWRKESVSYMNQMNKNPDKKYSPHSECPKCGNMYVEWLTYFEGRFK